MLEAGPPRSARTAASGSDGRAGARGAAAPSWWTARARTGQVVPGFSKQEMLKPVRDDPRQPGGILERVAGLLVDLAARA
jgi:hypothetical protein